MIAFLCILSYVSVCRQAKVKTRRLEKIYRANCLMDQGAVMSARSTVAFRHWRIQTDVQRRVYQTAYSKLLVKLNK